MVKGHVIHILWVIESSWDATAYTQRSDFNNILLIIDEDGEAKKKEKTTYHLETGSELDSVIGTRSPWLRTADMATRFLKVVQMC